MMIIGQYDPKISVAKGNAAATNVAIGGLPLAVLIGFVRGSWPGLLPWPIEMDAGAITILAAVYAWVQAWRVNRKKHVSDGTGSTGSGTPIGPATVGLLVVFVALALALAAGGCTTARTVFEECIVSPDGSSDTVRFEGSANANLFGEIDTTNQRLDYRWGGPENRIGTGQQTSGLDNTGQSVIIPLVQSLVDGLLQIMAQLQAQAAANAVVGAVNLAPVP
jgi:hypothetical protein